jgi:group I intron endonuclease
MFVYKTTNCVNGKIYIGQSTFSPEEKPNYLGSGSSLKRDIKAIGKENFIREILEDGITDTNILNEREIYWISHFNSMDPNIGYNILKGGSFDNISEIIKEAYKSPILLAKISESSKKNWRDENYRNQVKESNQKTWSNEDLRKFHSDKMSKIFSTKEYKESLSSALKNMEKLECPHCKKILPKNHAISKHFDNCIHHTDPVMRSKAIERWNSIKNKTKNIECPHCNSSGSIGNMNRWHFDNCKHKKC